MFHSVTPEQAGIASEKVLEFLRILDKNHFCTHSILMARGDKLFCEGYYAPFNREFKHRMYSVSKSFVGVAVGLAVEDGLLTLEDPFVKFFPEYLNEHTNTMLEQMTIRDMLTMETAMIERIWWFSSGTDDRCEVYFRTEAERIAGTTWTYDSPGSFMLCALVERLTGKPFLEYLKDRFLIKAGFSNDAYCLQCPGGHSFGDSGVLCTAMDLLVFARFVMDGGKIDGVSYMNEDFLKEATSKQVSNDHDGSVSFDSYGYGYQIWKAPNDGFAFVGMGDQFAICDREKDFIFVVNSDNQGHSPATRAILYETLYRVIVDNLGEALPENAKAHEELKTYISNMKLFCLPGKQASSFATELHRRTYQLDTNPMGIEYVHFEFRGDEGELTYKNAQGIKRIPFGFGHNVFSKFPQENYADKIATVPAPGNMYDCAVSAEWTEERKLLIKVQIIDIYFGNMSMEFGFLDDKVGICMRKNAEAFLDEYQGYANGRLILE